MGTLYGYGSIPIDTFLVGWTSIYQLFWGSLGSRVLTHPHMIDAMDDFGFKWWSGTLYLIYLVYVLEFLASNWGDYGLLTLFTNSLKSFRSFRCIQDWPFEILYYLKICLDKHGPSKRSEDDSHIGCTGWFHPRGVPHHGFLGWFCPENGKTCPGHDDKTIVSMEASDSPIFFPASRI